MSYADVSSTLATMKTQTNAVNYAKNKENSGNTMGEDAFLQLMITELQNQDPLEPMDNSEFLSQQAMFTQVSTMQEMNENLAGYGQTLVSMNQSLLNSTTMNQAMNLVGKEVTATNPENSSDTITGVIDSVKITDNGIIFNINGKEVDSSWISGINNTNKTTATSEEDASLKTNLKTFLSDLVSNPNLKTAVETIIGKYAANLL